MNDLFPKFIIEGDNLVIAKCTFHNQLTNDKEKVKGGGSWRLDRDTNTFILCGSSFDFGAATVEDIKTCIEKGNVFTDKYEMHNIADRHNFSYDTGTELINLKTKKQ